MHLNMMISSLVFLHWLIIILDFLPFNPQWDKEGKYNSTRTFLNLNKFLLNPVSVLSCVVNKLVLLRLLNPPLEGVRRTFMRQWAVKA